MKNTIGVKTRVVERKSHRPQRGVVVSTDPQQPGRKQKWLVLFDGEKKAVPRSSQQLLFDDTTQPQPQALRGSSDSDDESDTHFPAPSSPFGSEREEEDASSLTSVEMSDEDSPEPYDAHESHEDVLEHEEMDDNGDVDNPFFTNASALEKPDEYKKKFNSYLKKKRELLRKKFKITMETTRKTKVIEGNKVTWVSVKICC